MKIESDSTREDLRALMDFPQTPLPDYFDDRFFQKRTARIIGTIIPPGTRPKVWQV